MEPGIADELRAAAELADRHYRLGAVHHLSRVQSSYLEASTPFIPLKLMLLALAELERLTGSKIQ